MAADLAKILAPLAIDEWVAKYWNQRSLHIPGAPKKFSAFAFDTRAMYAAIERSEGTGAFKVAYQSAGQHRELAPKAAEARALYEGGKTLCLETVDRVHPPLHRLVRRLQFGVGSSPHTSFSAYMSPDGAGFGLHFDDRPVVLLQIEGAKEWRYSATPAVRAPLFNVIAGTPEAEGLRIPSERSLERCTLQPGHALFLPAGAWHRGRGRGSSLALTLRFPRLDALTLFERALRTTLRREEVWREIIPLAPANGALCETIPPHMEAFWTQRLHEFQRVVAALTPQGLHDAWLDLVHRSPPIATLPPPSPVKKGDRLHLTTELRCTRVDDGILCYGPGAMTKMPDSALPFLRALCKRRRFVATEAHGFGGERRPWKEVAALLQQLLDQGLLTR